MMGPQATSGFQAPEPYVPESAKHAGALYEAGVAPSIIRTMTNESAPFDPVAYRNQFKSPNDDSGLASVAQPIEPVSAKQPTSQGPVSTFIPQRGKGEFSPRQQMPSFYQQPMGMMAQPFNPMGYGPMGMFMNPYGGLGGMAYNFMNSYMPLYSQGGQFQAGEYTKPETTESTQGTFSGMPYFGGFNFY